MLHEPFSPMRPVTHSVWISNRKHVEDSLILKLQARSPHAYVEIANAMNIGNRTINPNNSKVEPLSADVKSA